MTTERDPRTRIVLSWLREETHENAERVLLRALDEVDATPQRRSWWPAWRTNPMNTFARSIAAAAAVVVVVVVAYTVLPGLGIVGPGASPSPSLSPSPSRFSSSIHGISMDYPTGWQVRPATEPWTEGELSFDSAAADVIFDPALGSRVYVILASQPLGPASATDWSAGALGWLCTGGGESWAITVDGVPGQAYSCTGSKFAALIPTDGRGYLIQLVVANGESASFDYDWLKPYIETIDLRPEAAVAAPSPSPALLARGDFVTIRRGAVTLDAFGEGSSVTGRMTVSSDGASFTVDLQCARTTEDGLVMIGGPTIETANGGSGLSPVGTWAAIVLRRGSPVQATVWSQRGGGTGATSCLAYLDERFDEKLMDPVVDDDDPGPIEGTVEFGP